MCLNNNRFKVEATFDTASGQSGQAQVVKLTDETGYLWFFSSNNIEVVVKALNACSFNNNYWIYSAGLTDVHVVLNVTDTESGTVKTYTNPQGQAFQPKLSACRSVRSRNAPRLGRSQSRHRRPLPCRQSLRGRIPSPT